MLAGRAGEHVISAERPHAAHAPVIAADQSAHRRVVDLHEGQEEHRFRRSNELCLDPLHDAIVVFVGRIHPDFPTCKVVLGGVLLCRKVEGAQRVLSQYVRADVYPREDFSILARNLKLLL